MVQKRPYDDEEVFRISYKHPRQDEHTKELVSFSESVFSDDVSELPHSLEDGLTNTGTENDKELCGNISSADLPKNGDDTETSGPSWFSTSSWPSSSTSEEESLSEPPFYISLFPEYFSSERPIRTALSHCEEIYNFLVTHPPRKAVPIGPHHQVDIPSWRDRNRTVEGSSPPEIDEEQRLMGKCIIPMPDLTSLVHSDPKVGRGRSDCSCDDKGSLSCVRKHVKEEREELGKAVGTEELIELGFCDMGEIVALRWSEEEERAFHQAVFSNPVSLGKKFWEKLSVVFPKRSKRDIVSYYFNVFMLRKRADQNRCDPSNIDSDNDEEEVDDSIIESPTKNTADRACTSESDDKQIREGELCTSFDDLARNRIVSENGNLNGLMLEACYAKDWEGGFMSCFKSQVDFLPTCNVIEEVFGEEMKNLNNS